MPAALLHLCHKMAIRAQWWISLHPLVKGYWASVSQMSRSFSSTSGQEGAFRISSNLHPLLIQSLGSWMVIFGSLHLDDPWLFLDQGGIAHVFPEGRHRDKMLQKFPSKGWEAECLEKGNVIYEAAVDLCWFVWLHGKKLVLAFQLQRPQDKSRKGNRELSLGVFLDELLSRTALTGA